MFFKFIFPKLTKIISTGIFLTFSLTLKPASSAEKIRVIFGPFDFAVKVESLEIYAETGEIKQDLGFYLNSLDQNTQKQLQQFLQKRFAVSQIEASRLMRTSLGEDILRELGYVLRVSMDTNGLYPLRGAIVQAAANPEGFTVIDVLHNFPLESIYVNAESLLQFLEQLKLFSQYRVSSIEAIANLAVAESENQPLDNLQDIRDLSQPGAFDYVETTITVTKDRIRQTRQGLASSYSFLTYLYVPLNNPDPAPVVVISHGFGARRQNFTQLASHLASHGYVVAIPEHVGSDLAYRQELLEGKLSSALSPIEYLDRPRDITYLLDELTELVATREEWRGRINLNQVGVIGESLGGTTVLSLAGAQINPVRLREECGVDELNIDPGLILQCQAVSLPPTDFNLRDHRIKAVIAAHPLTSAIFGPEGMKKIEIPTMVVAGSNDFVTPVTREQIHPFIWLENPQKHLVVFEPGTHFTSSEPPENNPVDYIPGPLIGENRLIAFEYFRGLSVAFMNLYLQKETSDRLYLSAAYGKAMSQPDLNIYQIEALNPEDLTLAYGSTPPEPIIPPLLVTPNEAQAEILAEITSTGVIKMAMRRDAIPFGYINQEGDWTGYCDQFAVKLAEYVQVQLDLPFPPKIIKLPSSLSNRWELVAQKTVHLECGPNTITTNFPTVSFSQPFFITGTHFLVNAGNPNSINPNHSLAGVKIGVLQNTTNELLLENNYPEAEIVNFSGDNPRNNALQALNQSEIDTYFGDGILMWAEIQSQDLSLEKYEILPQLPFTCSYYGLILPKDEPEWRQLVNAFLSTDAAKNLQAETFPEQVYEAQKTDLNYCLNFQTSR